MWSVDVSIMSIVRETMRPKACRKMSVMILIEICFILINNTPNHEISCQKLNFFLFQGAK